jgi:hypothetical protein
MKPKYFIATAAGIVILAFFILSFQPASQLFQSDEVSITEVKGSPEFSTAELQLKSPANGATLAEGSDTFDFVVKNFQLGAQTPDADQKMCANSSKGQHIHFIMDNAPYVASYNPKIGADMKPGHHVLLAFLSRSYHESIKHKKAFILKEFNVGKDAKDDFDETAPHLFFSRPKGEYIDEKETKKVMLDFYLVNCNLSPDGYKVRATVGGKEFTITKWVPYVIENLKLGEQAIKLELLDKDNKLVKSPFNPVERTFKLDMNMMITPVQEKK